MPSLSNIARTNMLNELSLVEPQNLSALDLMRDVIDFPGQTLVTIVDGMSVGEHYDRYLIELRDSL